MWDRPSCIRSRGCAPSRFSAYEIPGYGDENAHVKEVLVVVGDSILDKIARLYGIGQLLIIGAGILHALELGAVEPDPLGDLIYGAAAVLTAEMDIDIHSFSGVDE